MRSNFVQSAVLEPLEERCLLDATAGPTATIVSMPSVQFNDKYLQVVVKYTDTTAIDRATITYDDVVLTGPDGYTKLAYYRVTTANSDNTIITATYTFQAPETAWGEADNGIYTVTLQANQVFDQASNATPAGTLGTTTVAITNQDIYVSPTGLTTNKGTIDSPWPSVEYALSQSGGRKTFVLMPGVYSTPSTANSNAVIYIAYSYNGTAEYPTVITSQYRWQAIIDAGGTMSHGITTGDGCDYVIIDGLEVRNALVGGIKTYGNHCVISNNWTHNNGHGIEAHAGTSNGVSWGDYTIIENNLIEHNGRNTTGGGDHGIYADGTGMIVRNNIVRYNAAFGIHLCPNSIDAQVYNNLVYGQIYQAGIVLGTTSGLVGNNQVFNNTILNCNNHDGYADGIEKWGNTSGRIEGNVVMLSGVNVSALDAISSNNILDYVAVAPELFNLLPPDPTPATDITTDIEAPVVTITPLATKTSSPALSGMVNDATAIVTVTVNGLTYTATNSGTGTWTLDAGTIVALLDGTYSVTVTASDSSGNVGTDATNNELTVDGTAPAVTINALATKNASPALSGRVNDPAAIVSVTVNGLAYDATNNADGTWTLAAGTIADLTDGTYSVTVSASDSMGNVGTDITANELSVDLTAPIVTINTLSTKVFSPAMSGTVNDPNAAVLVTVNGQTYTAVNNGNGTWTLAAGRTAKLPAGTYSVTVSAIDAVGNVGTDATNNELAIDLTAPAVTVSKLTTKTVSPAISGTVDDPAATIAVTVNGRTYTANNNGNGTWTLAAGTITNLIAGTYTVKATAIDLAGNIGTDTTANELTIDLTVPTVTVSTMTSGTASPSLTGKVNDATAIIAVTVNGLTYTATNNGNGTWTLAAGTIAHLANSVYNVTVTATDSAGNVGTDATSNELVVLVAAQGIDSTQSVVLGMGTYKVMYVDADGTAVTISSGKGDIAVSFTGSGIATTTDSRSKTVTVTGAITKVDLEVVTDTSALTIKTNTKGDGLTSINQITGSGILGKLTGTKVDLIGGIDMATGLIKNINLHSIRSDVTMAKLDTGVVIKAGIIANSIIDTDIIKSLRAVSRYQNTSVSADTIGTVKLSNVETDNGGTLFGISATTIKSLKVQQGKTWQTWGKNFTTTLGDFSVAV
jgi:hypothetical protein